MLIVFTFQNAKEPSFVSDHRIVEACKETVHTAVLQISKLTHELSENEDYGRSTTLCVWRLSNAEQ